MAAPSVEEVANKISSFFKHHLKEDDIWLQNFQKSAHAWSVCTDLIHLQHLEVKFVAATILLSKVWFEWSSLDDYHQKRLLSDLANIALQCQDHVVFVRICHILAAAAIRTQVDQIDGVIQGFFSLRGQEDIQKMLLLEFLSNLPSEQDTAVLSFTTRSSVQTILRSKVEEVMSTIQLCIRSPNKRLVSTALQCLHNWIRFGIPPSYLFGRSDSVIDILFGLIMDGDLFAICVDNLLELLQKPMIFTNAKHAMKNTLAFQKEGDHAIIVHIIQRVLSLQPAYQAAYRDGSVDFCRGICQIAAAVAEGHVEQMASGGPDEMLLLEFILTCTAHPNKPIAELGLDFWSLLENTLHSQADQKKAFVPIFTRLLGILLHQCSFPPKFTSEKDWENDEQDPDGEEFYSLREACLPALEDIFHFLGMDAYFTVLMEVLQSTNQWQPVEAVFFCAGAVGPVVRREWGFQRSPMVAALIQRVWTLPFHVTVAAAACKVLGEYADCLGTLSLLTPAINYIVPLLSNQETSSIAAQALNNVTKSSASALVPGLEALLETWDKLLGIMQIPADKILVVESLTNIVSCLPHDKIGSALERLNNPVVHHLKHLGPYLPLSDVNTISGDLQVLAAGLKLPKVSEMPIVFPLENLWETLNVIWRKWEGQQEIMEQFCTIYKSLLWLLKSNMGTVLSQLVTNVLDCFAKCGFPCFLDVISTTIEIFGKESSMVENFAQLLKEAARRTFVIMQADVKGNAEIAQAFFDLLNKVIALNSNLMLAASEILPTTVELAIACLVLEERDALKAVMQFLDGIFVKQNSNNGIVEYGERLVKGILFALATNVQCRPLMQSDLFHHLVTQYTSLVGTWIVSSLMATDFPSSLLSPADKETFFQVLLKVNDKRRFKSLVQDFSNVCNGRATADVFVAYQLL